MIAALEDAIIARIKAANVANAFGYKLREIDSYGTQLDDDLMRVVVRFPAVWVTFIGTRNVIDAGGITVQEELVYSVVCAARSVRNEASTRKNVVAGDKFEVGSTQIVEDVRRLLHGQTFGLEINAVQAGPVTALVNGKDAKGTRVSIYGCEFAATRTLDYVADAPVIQGQPVDLRYFQHDIQPLVIVDTEYPPHQRPDDEEPGEETNVSDRTTLPQN